MNRLVGIALFSLFLCAPFAQATESLRQRLESTPAGYSLSVHSTKLRHGDQLLAFYQANQFAPLWVVNGRLQPMATELMTTIAAIGDEGLLPQDYHQLVLNALAVDPTKNAVDLELVFSDALLTLGGHLLSGKSDPKQLSDDWKAKPRSRDLLELLGQLRDGNKLELVLNSVRPNQIRYFRLIKTLQQMRALSDIPWPVMALSPTIKSGVSDERLPLIAERLKLFGDLADDWQGENYDAVIEAAMVTFQQRHGLAADGAIGRESFTALNISPRDRIPQIVVNLERWRWLEGDLGEQFVLVNIAAFDIRIINKNRTVFRKPVIVGRDFRKTPVFSDQIRYLVFNPTWTVPWKLAVEDKLPEIKKDINYLSEFGFSVYEGNSSILVDPATVDWSSVNKRNFNYRFVQAPGPLNALGQVKFMFPNAFDVYLHDTPARDLFTKHQRAFSSGCIRVSDPLELAAFLLQEDGWTRDMIDEVIASEKLKTVFLKKPVPVHIEYWTAWVNSAGTVNFRNDIYQRDKALYLSLQQPLAAATQL